MKQEQQIAVIYKNAVKTCFFSTYPLALFCIVQNLLLGLGTRCNVGEHIHRDIIPFVNNYEIFH
jgi:hypothetical protein